MIKLRETMDSKIMSAAKGLQIKTRTGAETYTGYGVVILSERNPILSDIVKYICESRYDFRRYRSLRTKKSEQEPKPARTLCGDIGV